MQVTGTTPNRLKFKRASHLLVPVTQNVRERVGVRLIVLLPL